MRICGLKKNKKETGNPATIRLLNRNAVLDYVRQHQISTRVELVSELNLAPATVTAVVGELLQDSLLIEVAEDATLPGKRARGRPSRDLRLNPRAAFALGLSIRVEHGVIYIDSAWSDYCNDICFGGTYRCQKIDSFKAIFDTIIQVLDQLLLSLPAAANIVGLGIAIPGVVSEGHIHFAPNVPALVGGELFKNIQAKVDCPVYFENDVNLLVVQEVEKRADFRHLNASYLFVSQGVAAGTALQGELWRASGWAGEIGQIQIPIDKAESIPLERLIGFDGRFARQMAEQGVVMDATNSFPLELLDTPPVKALLDEYTRYLRLAVEILNTTFDLDVVIVGTSHVSILDYCIPLLIEQIKQSPLKVNIVHTSTAQNAAAEGATLMALRQSMANLHDRQVNMKAVAVD